MVFCEEVFKLDGTPRKWTIDVLKYLHKHMGEKITKNELFKNALGMSPEAQRRGWHKSAALDSCLVETKKLILKHEGKNPKIGRTAGLYSISKKGIELL